MTFDSDGDKITTELYCRTMSDRESAHVPKEIISACKNRQQRVRELMENHHIDGLLVGFDREIQYLTNFIGDDCFLLIRPEGAEIITDTRYEQALKPWAGSGIGEPFMGTRHRLMDSVRELCDTHGITRLGIQAEHVSLAMGKILSDTLGRDRLVETTGLIARLRMRKDSLEITLIEKALRIQEEALRRTLGRLELGMTENELYAVLEYEIKCLGAMGSSFNPIIAWGPGSSVPHYESADVPIQEGVLLIDWGARTDWYCGDLTRTYGIISMPPKIQEIYPIVLEAQLAAIEACGPGKVCADIDSVARKILTDAGYGPQFNHGLGHSMGIEVHESPYFNDLQTDVELEPGMVMTVEPGIYLPGVGGVRIEDDVLITEDGCRVLSDFPKDMDSVVIEPAGSTSAIA